MNYTKMHGLGNSYIYIDAFKHTLIESELPQLARFVSNVNFGIGSDGLILIGPSAKADLKMRIFNKDGSEAKNCGNGLRCVARYAIDNQLVKSSTLTIETLGGVVQATMHKDSGCENWISVNMGKPRLLPKEIPLKGFLNESVINKEFVVSGQCLQLTAVSMGNPHAVFFIDHDDTNLHQVLGPLIEKDPRFPEGVNVEFVHVKNPNYIHCYVWERGSGVTQACGTGACAAVVASVLNGYCQKDTAVTVRLAGGELSIRWLQDDTILMTGPASYVATGTLFAA